ncbi:MAG TPA: ERF family protein [Phycisphaerae bacterium]|nr:ERF family protein [Phycisphaerae bacterium]
MPPKATTEPGGIYSAITAVMQDVGAIAKTQHNEHQNYDFRGIDNLYDAMQPAFIKHGLFVLPILEEGNYKQVKTARGKPAFAVHVRVRHRFCAGDGSFVEAVTAGEAMDSGDRATAKAMTDAFKTAVFKVFCIPVDASDPEKDTHELGNGKPNVAKDESEAERNVSAGMDSWGPGEDNTDW